MYTVTNFKTKKELKEAVETGDESGWYWWSCFPGCIPDSDPYGPFLTEAEAIADAQVWDGELDDKH